ncbi:MAG TPA: plastocyanin/azurin family copper-binding protein [Candidatus Acidoferrales bacterium]|nr:plastocyanin/azurin family copper-binding protein [Candidatus Acidoferrales bacterium]
MRQRLTGLVLSCVMFIFSQAVRAQSWQLQVGAQTGDKAHQALAFLPNEIWIHPGDSITWTFAADEIHTVTFLKPAQVRPSRFAGCPGATPDFSVFDGTACVNSGVISNNDASSSAPTYTVVFPVAGNFKLVCLAHPNMTATIHVLELSAPLPHDQAFYDKQADRERADLLSHARASAHEHSGSDDITAGVGHIIGNGGGTQTASVMRFMHATKVIHVGETVEWTSAEAVTSHTVTFGTEPDPLNQIPPSANVTVDADGARHAFISSPSDAVHSGFITQAPQDRTGLAQAPLGVTRFRVTFTQPGVYQYKCVLHDELGMVGEVIVLP